MKIRVIQNNSGPRLTFIIWTNTLKYLLLFFTEKLCIQVFTSQELVMDFSRVDYVCDFFFISCLDSNSGCTHSLQRIQWWASIFKLNLFKPVLMKKQIHHGWGWIHVQLIFIFGWTIPLNDTSRAQPLPHQCLWPSPIRKVCLVLYLKRSGIHFKKGVLTYMCTSIHRNPLTPNVCNFTSSYCTNL